MTLLSNLAALLIVAVTKRFLITKSFYVNETLSVNEAFSLNEVFSPVRADYIMSLHFLLSPSGNENQRGHYLGGILRYHLRGISVRRSQITTLRKSSIVVLNREKSASHPQL